MDDGGGLENRYAGNCIVGSNPTPSATKNYFRLQLMPLRNLVTTLITISYDLSFPVLSFQDPTIPSSKPESTEGVRTKGVLKTRKGARAYRVK